MDTALVPKNNAGLPVEFRLCFVCGATGEFNYFIESNGENVCDTCAAMIALSGQEDERLHVHMGQCPTCDRRLEAYFGDKKWD